jgi:hypothetical protein
VRRPLAAASLLIVLAGCGGPRNALNTSASACFRGLPTATAAVGPKGRVVGVRTVARRVLARDLPQADRIPADVVCAVAYRGDFVPGDVANADPPGPGRFAVVALDTRGSHVLATFVVDTLPIPFHHRV